MRRVSKQAGDTLTALAKLATEEGGYLKLDQGGSGVMPLSVEMLDCNGMLETWAVGHWYTMNGDACRDPEVVFLRHAHTEEWFPVEYRQETPPLNIHQQLVTLDEDLKPVKWMPKAQKSVAGFCHVWMRNVRAQQHLDPKTVAERALFEEVTA